MKKFILLFILLLLFFSYKNTNSVLVFNEINDNNIYDSYNLEFEECDLSTNNFIDKFSFFNNKDYKILEIIPFKNNDDKYLFYTNNLNDVLDKFKNKYINNIINEDKYVTNICIKNVRIYTSNYDLNEFKNIINFSFSTK